MAQQIQFTRITNAWIIKYLIKPSINILEVIPVWKGGRGSKNYSIILIPVAILRGRTNLLMIIIIECLVF